MDLSRCEGCNFENNENCMVYTICKIIEFSNEPDKLKELLSNQNPAMVKWATKQA